MGRNQQMIFDITKAVLKIRIRMKKNFAIQIVVIILINLHYLVDIITMNIVMTDEIKKNRRLTRYATFDMTIQRNLLIAIVAVIITFMKKKMNIIITIAMKKCEGNPRISNQ